MLRGNGGWELSAQVLWVGCNTCKITGVGLAAHLVHQCFGPPFIVVCLCDCLVLPGKQGQVDVWPWCTRGPVTTCEGFLFKWRSNSLYYTNISGRAIFYLYRMYSILFYSFFLLPPFLSDRESLSLYVFLPQVFGSCFLLDCQSVHGLTL